MRAEILRELRRRVADGLKVKPPEKVALGTDLDETVPAEPVGAILPGDDDPAEEGISTVNRTWEVVIGVSVPVQSGDPDGWFQLEKALRAVLDKVEADRRLGGLLTLDIERGEVGSIVREPAGKAVGVTVGYELTYTEPGILDPYLGTGA